MIVHYNERDHAGRAIAHLLEKSALADITEGLEVKEYADGGRTLIVHPQLEYHLSRGQRALLLSAESLAGASAVTLNWLLADVDTRSRRAICEAVFIAAGFSGATLVSVA